MDCGFGRLMGSLVLSRSDMMFNEIKLSLNNFEVPCVHMFAFYFKIVYCQWFIVSSKIDTKQFWTKYLYQTLTTYCKILRFEIISFIFCWNFSSFGTLSARILFPKLSCRILLLFLLTRSFGISSVHFSL